MEDNKCIDGAKVVHTKDKVEDIYRLMMTCKKCASKDLMVNYFLGFSGRLSDFGKPLDGLIASGDLEENDSGIPYFLAYCNDCGEVQYRDIDLSKFESSELMGELKERAKQIGLVMSDKEKEFLADIIQRYVEAEKDYFLGDHIIIHDVEYDLANGGIKWEPDKSDEIQKDVPRDESGNIVIK